MLEFKIVKTLAVYNSYLFQCLSCTFLMANLLNVILSNLFFFLTQYKYSPKLLQMNQGLISNAVYTHTVWPRRLLPQIGKTMVN